MEEEEEYYREQAYITAQKDIENWQQWEEEQNKLKKTKIVIKYEGTKQTKVARVTEKGIFSR